MDFQALNKGCTRCPLRSGCNQVVTGIGNPNTSLFIVGEAPGADEDLLGEPFVGRSGDLLTKLLRDVKINREDIYISNVVKCRPPGNRKPKQEEIQQCKIWLWKEIQSLLNLKIIITLGATSTELLLSLSNVIMKTVVGKAYQVKYTQAKIMPWYHPSFLLRRNKEVKGEDGKLIDRTRQWLQHIKEQI